LRFKDVEFDENSKASVDLYMELPQDRRDEAGSLLGQILSDGRVEQPEKNLFDDKYVQPHPALAPS